MNIIFLIEDKKELERFDSIFNTLDELGVLGKYVICSNLQLANFSSYVNNLNQALSTVIDGDSMEDLLIISLKDYLSKLNISDFLIYAADRETNCLVCEERDIQTSNATDKCIVALDAKNLILDIKEYSTRLGGWKGEPCLFVNNRDIRKFMNIGKYNSNPDENTLLYYIEQLVKFRPTFAFPI